MLFTAVLCILAVILVQSSVSIYIGTYYEWDEGTQTSIEYEAVNIANFGIIAFILGAACTVMPILELSGLKNKRNLDTLYALPVSRSKMALTHYLSGFVQAAVIYTVAYITLVLKIIASPFFDCIHSPILLLPCYFVVLLAGLTVYSIFIAIFNSANTIADGCFFMAVWSLLPMFFVMAMEEFESKTSGMISIQVIDSNSGFVMYPHAAMAITENFFRILTGRRDYSRSYTKEFIFWAGIGVILAGVYFYSFVHKRAEKINDSSDTFFGYRTIIPIIVFCLSLSTDSDPLSLIFAVLASVVGYMLYRRSFKIKIRDIAVTACVIAFVRISCYLL
jgi:hypothetical protein